VRPLAAAALVAALVGTPVAPATAFVAEVTTSISMADIADDAQLKAALQEVVDSVLKDAIAFKPTVVVLMHAVVRRGRLYVRLLVADQDGERTFHDLDREPEAAEVTL
jgi:hypothetical protein